MNPDLRSSLQVEPSHWTKSPAEAFRRVDHNVEKRIDQNKRNDSAAIFNPGIVDEEILRQMYAYKKQ